MYVQVPGTDEAEDDGKEDEAVVEAEQNHQEKYLHSKMLSTQHLVQNTYAH